ncbi:hypothetical protein Tco_0835874 [Tanacetum coccineum]
MYVLSNRMTAEKRTDKRYYHPHIWTCYIICHMNTAPIFDAVAIPVSCSRLVATIPFPTSPTVSLYDTKRNSVDYIQVGTSLGRKSISKSYAPSSRSNGGVIEYYKTL